MTMSREKVVIAPTGMVIPVLSIRFMDVVGVEL